MRSARGYFFSNFTSVFVSILFFCFEFCNRMLLTQEMENGKRITRNRNMGTKPNLTLALFTHHK